MSAKKVSFQGKDSFCRMNFLYQASLLMAGKHDVLSCYYGNLCRNIGKKSVLRMEPDAKRTLCKKCCLAQKPGVTAEVYASSEGNADIETHFVMMCKKCNQQRSFRINPRQKFWLENPESVAEVFCLEVEKSAKPSSKRRRKQKKKTPPKDLCPTNNAS